MAGLAVAAAVVCMTLPETFNQPTIENLATDDTTDGNKNDKAALLEDTAIWEHSVHRTRYIYKRFSYFLQ